MDQPRYASLELLQPARSRISGARRLGLMVLPALLLIGMAAFASTSVRRAASVPRSPLAPELKQQVAPAAAPAPPVVGPRKCSGAIDFGGWGNAKIVSADSWGPSMVQGAAIVGNKSHGRGYFAESCADGPYNHEEYMALNPLGKTIKYTVDLSGAGCGCNVAFYLASMRQNTAPSEGNDFYCDACGIGGVNCAEIDIQESNVHAWMTTLHVKDDINGAVVGYGGDWGKPDYRDWSREEYGIGGRCVDTNFPFNVWASFHTDGGSSLTALEIHLYQDGKECSISKRNQNYHLNGRDVWAELTANLQAGMTPILSYWVDKNLGWFDGPGQDGNGPCAKGADDPMTCPDAVKFSGFAITPIGA